MTGPAAESYTAAALVERIRRAGGRIHRMQEPGGVFVLTEEPRLAAKLLRLGGQSFTPVGMPDGVMDDMGGYLPGRGAEKRQYDIWIQAIPVEGDETIWEAAGGHG
jgi:hypothetical protein